MPASNISALRMCSTGRSGGTRTGRGGSTSSRPKMAGMGDSPFEWWYGGLLLATPFLVVLGLGFLIPHSVAPNLEDVLFGEGIAPCFGKELVQLFSNAVLRPVAGDIRRRATGRQVGVAAH